MSTRRINFTSFKFCNQLGSLAWICCSYSWRWYGSRVEGTNSLYIQAFSKFYHMSRCFVIFHCSTCNSNSIAVTVGAAVAVVGLAAYRVYAARKNASSWDGVKHNMPVMVSNIKFLLSDFLCHGLLLWFSASLHFSEFQHGENANIFVIAALDLLHISRFSFVASQLESTGQWRSPIADRVDLLRNKTFKIKFV